MKNETKKLDVYGCGDGNSGLHIALAHGNYEVANILLASAKNFNDNYTTLE